MIDVPDRTTSAAFFVWHKQPRPPGRGQKESNKLQVSELSMNEISRSFISRTHFLCELNTSTRPPSPWHVALAAVVRRGEERHGVQRNCNTRGPQKRNHTRGRATRVYAILAPAGRVTNGSVTSHGVSNARNSQYEYSTNYSTYGTKHKHTIS